MQAPASARLKWLPRFIEQLSRLILYIYIYIGQLVNGEAIDAGIARDMAMIHQLWLNTQV